MVGNKTEKLARVRYAPIHKHGDTCGYYLKCNEKSLKGSQQGSDKTQFISAGWTVDGHGGVRWTREEAGIPVWRLLQ